MKSCSRMEQRTQSNFREGQRPSYLCGGFRTIDAQTGQTQQKKPKKLKNRPAIVRDRVPVIKEIVAITPQRVKEKNSKIEILKKLKILFYFSYFLFESNYEKILHV